MEIVLDVDRNWHQYSWIVSGTNHNLSSKPKSQLDNHFVILTKWNILSTIFVIRKVWECLKNIGKFVERTSILSYFSIIRSNRELSFGACTTVKLDYNWHGCS